MHSVNAMFLAGLWLGDHLAFKGRRMSDGKVVTGTLIVIGEHEFIQNGSPPIDGENMFNSDDGDDYHAVLCLTADLEKAEIWIYDAPSDDGCWIWGMTGRCTNYERVELELIGKFDDAVG